MIVTRLLGGLGNQMFQYAYGFALAKQSGQTCYLDVSGFESYTLHPSLFKTQIPRCSDPVRDCLPRKQGNTGLMRRIPGIFLQRLVTVEWK
jgi:hypothetical protein